MLSKRLVVVGLVAPLLLAAGPASADAKAKRAPRVSVTPAVVTAGGSVSAKVRTVRGKRCVLSLRVDTRGALTRYRRRAKNGRMTLAIPASSAPGRRVVTVTCGKRRAAARFTVLAAPAAQNPALTAPALLPDEQGFIAGDVGSQEGEFEGQRGAGDYANARIADIALSKLGQDLTTPGPLDHGQCKQAVNDWVNEASGGTQRLGGDYYSNYARNGGLQVGRDDVQKGDIIQLDRPSDIRNYYKGMHTAVVVGHTRGSNTFDVVDSNWQLDGVVRRHAWDPYASGAKYGLRVTIWRMGSVDAPTPPPAPAPAPPPTPDPTWAETTGGPTNTWTNYTNAGGTQGPTIPARQTVQISCKLHGFRVADGNTWWYRIASGPWNNQFYASADAFYNNGATSGSLLGTPFVDGAVRDC